jgi:hypothetical protein
MAGKAKPLPAPLITPTHQLRRTYEGLQQLKQSGRFKQYMSKYDHASLKEFIAWDGEGWTDTNGEHRYMLLQNSEGQHISAPVLDTVECLEFMLKTAKDFPKRIHVIFGGGYDATHILRFMPLEKRRELRDTGHTVFYPKDGNHYTNRFTLEYIPHKWLTITGHVQGLRKPVTLKLFDVMTFFQSAFIYALESRDIEVPDVIKTGKANRQNFTYHDLNEIIQYCQMELEMLVMLCNVLRQEFKEAGINVTQFHGPGAVASATFNQKRIRKHMQAPPLHIEQAAQRAYFGGRFELFKAGHHKGKIYQYDINSAYPDKIRDLPSLAGSEWVRTDDYDGSMGLWFCSYDYSGSDHSAPHPTPWRGTGGKVGFPTHNKGVWLWHHEAKFATEVHYGYKLILANDTKPFAFVAGMYDLRAQWKKEGKGAERALKLCMSSLYGKTAQRIGGSEKYGGRPSWHQLEWAGMITSATRAQIWEAVAQSPESIIAIETDSVASTVPLDLEVGTGLGQWELKVYDWITYIQSGIYFTNDGATGTKAKSRGIDVKQLHHKDVLDFLGGRKEELLVSSRQFVGLTNPQEHFYGQWQDSVKEVKIAGSKRLHIPADCLACSAGLPMDEVMHTLTSNPLYGLAESVKHPLPWLDDVTELTTSELLRVNTDAIAMFETSGRHSPTVDTGYFQEGRLEDIPW